MKVVVIEKKTISKRILKIKPYLRDMIINLQKSDKWKIQLTIAMNFISSKDVNEEHVMHLKSDNIEFTLYDNANGVFNKLFESLLSRCQIGLETSMRGGDFIFDSVQLLYYKCQKINFKRGGSYIDSPDRIKKKKATIYLKNTDDKCFQYAVTVAVNFGEIKWNPERGSNIKSFINKYNCKGINYPTKIDDLKTSAKKIQQLLLIFCILQKKKYVQLIFQNITSEKHIIFLMIPN